MVHEPILDNNVPMMDCMSILNKYFESLCDEQVPQRDTLRAPQSGRVPEQNIDAFFYAKAQHVSSLIEQANDVEEKDLDLIHYFYTNNHLLRDMYTANAAYLEREYLLYSFADLLNEPISRGTFVDLQSHAPSIANIKYRLRRLKQSVKKTPASLSALAVETICQNSLHTDLLPLSLKHKVLKEKN
jgi:hypothetical protein